MRGAGVAVLVAACATTRPAGPARGPAAVDVDVDAIAITVSDLDRAVAFYTDVLAFEVTTTTELSGARLDRLEGSTGTHLRLARLRLGAEVIELVQYLAPTGRPMPAGLRSNDRSFQHLAIVVSDMQAAWARLRAHGVAGISSAPQRLPDWNRNAGGIHAYYFQDPDGHPLEILQFPPDKGASRWHEPSRQLFLGIDHTAIVVADTATSVRFYRDLLGLTVAASSENYGPEQEQLNAVGGAHLRITTLRARSGPGIELLEYLAPRDGRPAPDTRPSDVLHRRVLIRTPDPMQAATRARTDHAPPSGAFDAVRIADPDGHAIELIRANVTERSR
jgi:catechol 2,3-dioxygenase-like lactoylglutathione lyase family enzyme